MADAHVARCSEGAVDQSREDLDGLVGGHDHVEELVAVEVGQLDAQRGPGSLAAEPGRPWLAGLCVLERAVACPTPPRYPPGPPPGPAGPTAKASRWGQECTTGSLTG